MFRIIMNPFVSGKSSGIVIPYSLDPNEPIIYTPDDALLDPIERVHVNKLVTALQKGSSSGKDSIMMKLLKLSGPILVLFNAVKIAITRIPNPVTLVVNIGCLIADVISGLSVRARVSKLKNSVFYKLLHMFPQVKLPVDLVNHPYTYKYTEGTGHTSACTLYASAAASLDLIGGSGNDDVGVETLKINEQLLKDNLFTTFLLDTKNKYHALVCSGMVHALNLFHELKSLNPTLYSHLCNVSSEYAKQFKWYNYLPGYAEMLQKMDYLSALGSLSNSLREIPGVRRPFWSREDVVNVWVLLRLTARFAPHILMPFQLLMNVSIKDAKYRIHFTNRPDILTKVKTPHIVEPDNVVSILRPINTIGSFNSDDYDSLTGNVLFYLTSTDHVSHIWLQKGKSDRATFVSRIKHHLMKGGGLITSIRGGISDGVISRHRIYVKGETNLAGEAVGVVVDSVSSASNKRDKYGLYNLGTVLDVDETNKDATLFTRWLDELYSSDSYFGISLVNLTDVQPKDNSKVGVVNRHEIPLCTTAAEHFALNLHEDYVRYVKTKSGYQRNKVSLFDYVVSRLDYSVFDTTLKFRFANYDSTISEEYGDVKKMFRLGQNYTVYGDIDSLAHALYDITMGAQVNVTLINFRS